jgi:hypothetical protein
MGNSSARRDIGIAATIDPSFETVETASCHRGEAKKTLSPARLCRHPSRFVRLYHIQVIRLAVMIGVTTKKDLAGVSSKHDR